jgi:hypothetical protein
MDGKFLKNYLILRRQLFEALENSLKQYGFKWVRRSYDMYKKFDEGKLGFHLSIVRHPEDFDIMADISIRLDKVQDLINICDDYLNEKEKTDTFTLGTELGNLRDGTNKIWTIRHESNIEPEVKDIMEWFRIVAIPYYEKYLIPKNVLEAISIEIPNTFNHIIGDNGKRAEIAVALAFLLGPEGRFNKVLRDKKAFLQMQADTKVPQFESNLKHYLKFIAYLRIIEKERFSG